jgi:hypothetical protein
MFGLHGKCDWIVRAKKSNRKAIKIAIVERFANRPRVKKEIVMLRIQTDERTCFRRGITIRTSTATRMLPLSMESTRASKTGSLTGAMQDTAFMS